QAEVGDRLERGTLRRRAQDVLAPGDRIVDVAVVRADVEVAQHHQLRVTLQLARQELAYPGQPVQLVGVFLVADRLAVDHVQVDHAQAADGGGQDPPLRVVQARNVGDDVGGLLAGQDRHAVVGLLARIHRPVAGRGQFVYR